MPYFGSSSMEKLKTCHPDLQRILLEAIKYTDFTIVCGHRNKADQEKAYREKCTQLDWPHSKHNSMPSLAVDIAPWHKTAPHIDWSDHEGFIYLAGIVKGVAFMMGYDLRWGGDWDGDQDQRDEGFRDLPHFELRL